MNPTRKTTCFTSLILLLLFSITLRAQTAEEIVAKHFEALGGKEKLQTINSLYVQTVTTFNGAEVDMKTWKVYDRLYRQEVAMPMGSAVIIATPRQGWASNPMTGVFSSLPSDQLRMLQADIDPAGPLADYNDKGCKIKIRGR